MGSTFIILTIGILALPPEGLPEIAGPATVIDGDTIVVNEQPIDLWGIDAPEESQTCLDPAGAEWPCGLYAKHVLENLVGTAAVICEPQGLSHDRVLVAVCGIDTRDLAWAMVAFGFALDVPEISQGAYGEPQSQSAAVHAGMWSGSFTTPHDWRTAQKQK